MKRFAGTLAFVAALGIVPGAILPAEAQQKAAAPADRGWPRAYTLADAEVVVHQPQFESWNETATKVRARVAVAVRLLSEKTPLYGVVELEARTATDHAARLVTMYKPEILSVRFPDAAPEKAAAAEKAVRSVSPTRDKAEIALDRVLAYVNRPKPAEVKVVLDPPPIFYSESEAILLGFLGPAKFVKIQDSPLEFAMNTSWDLLRDPKTSVSYLLFRDGWIQTADLANGPWVPAKELPKAFSKLPPGGAWDRVLKNVPGKTLAAAPKVFTSETPAELVTTKGRPEMETIAGTKLMWVKNSQNTLFFHMDERRFYFLAAGRWFRAADLAGPWTAATTNLPKDFAAIPKTHAKAAVLASVPGTAEAEDAVLLASIPKFGVVSRAEAKPDVSYDGEPKFEPIEGTTISAAVNTPNDVFKVGNDYYVCFQGVWFKASAGVFAVPSPVGPWEVADSVPAEIYKIPPTHPKYRVTYVKIVDATPETVTSSYTSGYEGEVVSSGVVMFGVGVAYGYGWGYPWYYPPYYWGWGMYPPYYGGVTFWAGAYGYGWSAYGPYGGAGYGARYNPATGVYSRGGYAYGPGGAAAWRAGYNPSTGVAGAQRGGTNAYGSWRQGAVTNGSDWARGGSISNSQGTLRGFQTSGGAAGIGGSGSQGSGYVVRDGQGNIYAGHDGNVYQRDPNGNWSSASGASPKSADAGTRDSLNKDYQSRQSGNARATSYSGSGSRGSYGGGGRSFSGGGRRR